MTPQHRLQDCCKIDDNIPYDFWVPAAFIEYYPMEDDKPDLVLPRDTVEYFLVNNNKITIYNNSQTRTPSADRLSVGDFIEVDSAVYHERKEKKESRYRIKEINGSKNHPTVGKWMEGNPIIYTNGRKIIYDDIVTPVDKNDPKLKIPKAIDHNHIHLLG